ncbi:thioredoxin family protein [Mangrovibacillus cuniculi]|uniref:Thioredoxin family protein n=1 Tax=Mangrovibacillus cuniculi TaxID=2593652 RepID=A0A7S8HGG4_9BACI|nr:thioredoxin family protein [Mangrovibacillus cuniculi]QPC47405.1 thioredoxin family protein [Mangrovibacillus cuniculi]
MTLQEWELSEFQENVEGKKTFAYYLYTPMCGTCQVASKMLEVAKELTPDFIIGKSDLNFVPLLANRYEVESVPCLIIFEDGYPIDKIYAFRSVPDLLEKLNREKL